MSSRNYEKRIQQIAKAFIKLGLAPRHSVAILAVNCPEWFYSQFGAIYAGGLAAGIYTTNSAESVLHILKVSRANIVIVDEEKQLQKVLSIRDQLPLLKAIVQLMPSSNADKLPGVYQWSDLEAMDVTAAVETEYKERQSRIGANEAAILMFTVSGCQTVLIRLPI